MILAILFVFILGYLAISLEHWIHVNKTASALVAGGLCWAIMALAGWEPERLTEDLLHHMGEIGQLLFFLMGAMTVVAIIEAHAGFDIVAKWMNVGSARRLLWVSSFSAFFLSAVLDNLTAMIVMTLLLRKLVADQQDRWVYLGFAVLAANLGGVWSPVGDVTTTMLWIGGQITAGRVVVSLLLPALLGLAVPMALFTPFWKSRKVPSPREVEADAELPQRDKNLVLILGATALVSVPIFKTLYHLPPFLIILTMLGFLWIFTELFHKGKEPVLRRDFSVMAALQRTDMPSVLFFLGILLAVASLASTGLLSTLAEIAFGKGNPDPFALGGLVAVVSGVLDNVPLVSALMSMFPLTNFPSDSTFWMALTFGAGAGGSLLIVGSAAGLVAMGMEGIRFGWYLKHFSLLAILAIAAGMGTLWLQELVVQ